MKCEQFASELQGMLIKKETLEKQMNLISVFRFLSIVIAIASILWGYFGNVIFLYFVSCLAIFVFMWLVQYHDQLKKHWQYSQAKCEVYQKHLDRIHYQWNHFKEDGNEWYDEKNYKIYDLDILGQHSLFQMINIAFTYRGRERLAQMLCYEPISYQQVLKHQNAVRDLSQHPQFILEVETYGHMLKQHQEKMIEHYLSCENIAYKMPLCIFGVSLLTIISAVAMFFSLAIPYSRIIFEIGAISQLCFVLLYFSKHQHMFKPIQKLEKSLRCFLDIFELIEKEQFQSKELRDLQIKICQEGKAIKGIRQLSIIASRVSYRQNIFAYLVLNSLGMFDFIIRNQYIDWLNHYRDIVGQWFEALHQLEAYMSLAVLSVDDFDVQMPEISQNRHLEFHQLKHPFIENAVGNDFHMERSVCVITGSNMSGKTTFMRTIGLNLVLAYAGGFVFADQMRCSLMHMMTSMRVKDNIEEGVSTFYGELLRIKEMISYAEKHEPMICFIDEIFKGTNSLDRIVGAKATIDKLSATYMMTFLTTHDVELCHQAKQKIDNYHFDEYYQDSRIYFDYQIKKGISQTTNGQFLLKQLGIIEEK